MREDCCHTFEVQALDLRNAGKGRAAVHYCKRDKAKRFQILKVLRCDTGAFVLAAAIGVRKNDPDDRIRLDMDLRDALGVELGKRVRLEVTKCGLLGTLVWFVTVRDPVVRVSAWLAVVSLSLGILSILLSFRD